MSREKYILPSSLCHSICVRGRSLGHVLLCIARVIHVLLSCGVGLCVFLRVCLLIITPVAHRSGGRLGCRLGILLVLVFCLLRRWATGRMVVMLALGNWRL